MIAISVEKVSKRYSRFYRFRFNSSLQEEREALRDISFDVREGETIGLLGPNGAGKTTLLKIITTLIYPNSGSVKVYGKDIRQGPTHARRMMGLVTCDERSFYWRLTGRQNLVFFGTLYGLTKRQVLERGEELLAMLGLSESAGRPYQEYSSGMKQKLAIARGLLCRPRIVFYDEPTRSLDPLSAQGIRKWIGERKVSSPDQTHVIATNQLSEADQLCDRVLIMSRGRLVAQGTIREIRERFHAQDYEVHRITYRGCRMNGQLKAAPQEGLFEVQHEEDGEMGGILRLRTAIGSAGLSRALKAILGSGGTVVRCHAEEVTFDEVFCTIVQGQ